MKTILIVDDEREMLEALKRFIEKRKIANILIATNIDETLKIYQENNKPEAVFIDLHIGNESGIDLLKNLKAIEPNIKAYFFTGDKVFADKNPPQKLGICGYIIKPILPAELIKIIEGL
ncbi:MAG: response regulator [Candidatus Omnitrophica bacterium]|nr:response regulator [Candidatus Omnitrophota bacterium]